MVNAGQAAGTVEAAAGAMDHWRWQGAVVEDDVVQGGDAFINSQADLGQGELERACEAAQLHCDWVPLPALVVQRPPHHCDVVHAINAQVHVRRPHRAPCVVVPARN